MKIIFRRLLRIIDYFSVLPRLRFLPTKIRYPVMIVDRTGSAVIAEGIPKNISFFTLPVRDEERYLNLEILRHFIFRLNLVFRGELNMLGLYVTAVAYALSTKLLITFIDNCSWDKGIHNTCPFRVLTVQNGLRSETALRRKSYDVFLGLGDRDTLIASDSAVEVETVGSLRLGLAYRNRKLFLKNSPPKSVDILFISQFRPDFWDSHEEVDLLHVLVIKTTIGWIRQIAQAENLSVGIALTAKGENREHWYAREKAVYAELLKCSFKEYHRELFEIRGIDCSYGGLFDARAVVSISSTLCFESLGIGKRPIMTTRLFGDKDVEHYDWFPVDEFDQFMIEPTYHSFRDAILTEIHNNEKLDYFGNFSTSYFCAFNTKALPLDLVSDNILRHMSDHKQ